MTATVLKHPAAATFADAPAVAAALQPEEPVFLYSASELKSRARQFLDHFPGTVSYAVKCNPSAEVITTLAEAGIAHWDVASVHEMKAVAAASANPVFHYHNPVKSRREIDDAYRIYNCRRFVLTAAKRCKKYMR